MDETRSQPDALCDEKAAARPAPKLTDHEQSDDQIERICLSVNSVCNLACSYCYFFARPDSLPGPESLSADEIETVLGCAERYAWRPGVRKRVKINFVGSGEPLLSWAEIAAALERFSAGKPAHRLRFYTVTNGLLLTRPMIRQMRALGLTPSVSLDGPEEIHDRQRPRHGGQGTFRRVLRGIELLREEGMPVAINTVLTRALLPRLPEFFSLASTAGLNKIIFDRLVDVPETEAPLSYEEFYLALRHIAEVRDALGLFDLEIGNLEAYRRAIAGQMDRVCTMFGSTCGAGLSNLMYMQREVYPCGRMFHDASWRLGRFDESLELFPARMRQRLQSAPAAAYRAADEGLAGPDCIIEQERRDYSPHARDTFVRWLGAHLARPEEERRHTPLRSWEELRGADSLASAGGLIAPSRLRPRRGAGSAG